MRRHESILIAMLIGCGAAACEPSEPSDRVPLDATEPPTVDAGSDTPLDHSTVDSDWTHDATPDTGGDENAADQTDAPLNCVGGVVWKPTSSAIEIRAFHSWDGRSGYLQQRPQLTGAQIAALDGLCLIPTPTTRLSHIMAYRIIVTDQDGTQTSYRASAFNYLDGNEGLPTIDVFSLQPFLATFSCSFSGPPRFPPTGAPPWDVAATMSTDPGCINGVLVTSACAPNWVKLKVDAPLTANIEVFECSGPRAALRLFTPDGATELAASDPNSARLCPYVSHAFAQGGTYLLSVDPFAGQCDAGGFINDVFLRVRF